MINYSYNEDRNDIFCKFCGKQCKNLNSLRQHEIRCPSNQNRIDVGHLSRYIAACRKGKTKANCKDIQKQVETMNKKYESGWRAEYERHLVQHIHTEHNNNEIQKWVDYVSTVSIDVPEYATYDNGGYTVVSNSTLTNWYNSIKETNTVLLEHVYFMMLVFRDQFTKLNVVHHVDENKSNNNLANLILFESVSDHVRFHMSDLAYLIYDEATHKFSCILKN